MLFTTPLALNSTGAQAQDYFQQLQEKLGLSSEKQSETSAEQAPTVSDQSATDSESLPAPIGNAPSTVPVPESSSGVPALTPVPTPFFPNEPARSQTDVDPRVPVPGNQDRPYLGLTVEQLQGGGVGLRVVEITRNSPGWKAGISPGDNLLAIDGVALTSLDQMAGEILKHAPGEAIRCLVDRRGRTITLPVVLGSSVLAEKSGMKPSSPTGLPPYIPVGPGSENADSTLAPDTSGATGNAVAQAPKATLGVSVVRLSATIRDQLGIPVSRGAVVQNVAPNSPARRGGLQPGDCIVEVDGNVIQSDTELFEWMLSVQAGQISEFRYYRGRTLMSSSIRLEPAVISSNGNGSEEFRLRPELSLGTGDSVDPNATNEQIRSLESQIQAMQRELDRAQRELEALRNVR